MDGWPTAIKSSLESLKSEDAVVVLPLVEVENGLKSGKVMLTWNKLRPRISPPVVSSTTPAADQIQVELPLSVVAPLFLAKRRPESARKKYAVNEEIPDVFTPSGKPTAAPPPTTSKEVARQAAPERPAPRPSTAPQPPAKPVAEPPTGTQKPPAQVTAPVSVPAASKPVSRPAASAPPAAADVSAEEIGELFGQPGRKNWTPAEIVKKTSELRGVIGALIALQDGLLVASQMPPGLNAETIAAFIPQMFTRMSQYCKELKFGDPSRLTFVVEDVPLKVYKGGGVYFTVLGCATEPLPDAQLNLVAAQLAPQSK